LVSLNRGVDECSVGQITGSPPLLLRRLLLREPAAPSKPDARDKVTLAADGTPHLLEAIHCLGDVASPTRYRRYLLIDYDLCGRRIDEPGVELVFNCRSVWHWRLLS